MKILLFSDIHSDLKALEKLLDQDADYYFCAGDLVSWARGLDKAGEILRRRAGRVFVIPGNHESTGDIATFCHTFGLENMHARARQFGKVHIAALGYSNPTPFDTPGEYSEQELARHLEPFSQLDPLVLVCHCPPKDSPLDQGSGGRHFGSSSVASFINRVSPRYFLCGHIHEAEGVHANLGSEGKTIGINVGKRGYLLDLATI
jgi:Icc-related predicted phosphoesterase